MRIVSALGWGGTVLGAISVLLMALTLLDSSPKHDKAPLGFAMLAILFGLPGLVLLWRLRQSRADRAFRNQLLGYIKSYDSFTVEELARKIGRTELQTEDLVAEIVQQDGVDLVFHRKTRQYLHRKRLQTNHKILSRCPSCGASLGAQIIFEGESPACQYCEHPLSADNAPPS